MKYLIAILVLLPLAASANPPTACPEPDPVLQFVGKTSELVNGQASRLGWTQACQSEFPGSTMCSTRDLIERGNLPSLSLGEELWICPIGSTQHMSTQAGYQAPIRNVPFSLT